MRSTLMYGPSDVRSEIVADPELLTPNDAIVRVVAACVCGSDLWAYRGIDATKEPRKMGHEAVGVVEEVGANVTSARPGDFVILPFSLSCGKCQACRHGADASCDHCAFYDSDDAKGHPAAGGCQSSMLRVADWANHTMVPVGLSEKEIEKRGLVPDLLTLSDVMCTGYHAAVAADVRPGDVVAVVGDGAVGLCAVIAAKLRGAKRIIAMSRHKDRAALALEFGATDVVPERGEDAVTAIRKLLDGDLVDAALECVGTKESMEQAINITRGGGRVGYVGVPHGGVELDVKKLFGRNLTIGGGMASARHYIPMLLPKVLNGEIHPGKVFDLTLPLKDVAKAYKAMDQRKAIKVLLEP